MPKTAQKLPDNNFSYDDIPYESYSYSHTHPQNLAFIGRLFGMNPASVKTARVLELGCAMGGNLLPLACLYPEAQFTGIDLSKTQIDQATKDAKALTLKNITFKQMDITEFPSSAGEFDYIICHGILSWVPEGVQDAVFDILQRHLAPQGLALLSYNCLPGWHFVKALREMMLFHTERFSNPKDKVTQARAFLDFVHDNTPASNTAYKQIVDTERQNLKNVNDSYLFHDHLENDNTPFYLHNVVNKAAAKDLQYVGDTSVSSMFIGNLPKEASEKLGALNNIILQEQYMDFLNNRRFRNSLFTRKDVTLNRALKGSLALELSVRALFRSQKENPDINQDVSFEKIKTQGTFHTKDKHASALLLTMAEQMAPVPVKEIIRRAAERYGLEIPALEEAASQNLIRLFLSNFVQFFSDVPPHAESLSKKPKAYKLARHQADHHTIPHVTNVLGESLPVNPHAFEILRLADGTRTVEEITEEFSSYIEKNKHSIMEDGAAITDPAAKARAIKLLVEEMLGRLLQGCVLVA